MNTRTYDEFKRIFSDEIKKIGFKKNNRSQINYYLLNPMTTIVLGLQKSYFGDYLYIEIGLCKTEDISTIPLYYQVIHRLRFLNNKTDMIAYSMISIEEIKVIVNKLKIIANNFKRVEDEFIQLINANTDFLIIIRFLRKNSGI